MTEMMQIIQHDYEIKDSDLVVGAEQDEHFPSIWADIEGKVSPLLFSILKEIGKPALVEMSFLEFRNLLFEEHGKNPIVKLRLQIKITYDSERA